jgi:hypothetical protein
LNPRATWLRLLTNECIIRSHSPRNSCDKRCDNTLCQWTLVHAITSKELVLDIVLTVEKCVQASRHWAMERLSRSEIACYAIPINDRSYSKVSLLSSAFIW